MIDFSKEGQLRPNDETEALHVRQIHDNLSKEVVVSVIMVFSM
jgi:hypothetical protein